LRPIPFEAVAATMTVRERDEDEDDIEEDSLGGDL
jgi:hypothetical protein